mgnify:CR=1 FL=1
MEALVAEKEPGSEGGWERPTFEVISLCCEITAYAPDDEPLF